ncbi:hypothetical protein FWF93_02685 [Candidatus Saccharibacteria bacterium]|nr:hypothetical protein [Candidatus Saccharibacteria bacterium]
MSKNEDAWYDSLPKDEHGLLAAETNPDGAPDQSQTLPERERGGAKWSTHTSSRSRKMNDFVKSVGAKKRRNKTIGFSVGFVGLIVIGSMLFPSSIFGTVLGAIEKYGDPISAALARNYNSSVTTRLGAGTCSSANCQWKQFSQKELTRLESAGAKMYSGGTEIKPTDGGGKMSIDRIEIEGKVLTASNYEKELANSAKLRQSMKGVYNARYQSQAGKAWSKMRQWHQLSKAKNLKGNNVDDIAKALDDVVTKRAAKLSKIDDAATKQVERAMRESNPGVAQRIGQATHDAVSLSGGVPNYFCGLYNGARAANLGAKTIRKAWMIPAAFAMINLLYAIKDGGEVSMQDTEAAGKFFSDFDADGTSALNSYGGNYAVYGDAGPLSESAASFSLGGNGPFRGLLGGLAATLAFVGITNIRGTCGFVRNPIVQFGDMVLGGLAAFFTGGGVKIASTVSREAAMTFLKNNISTIVKNTMKSGRFWAAMTFEASVALLPIYLQNVLGGQMPSELSKENNGDMFFAGAEAMYADVGKANSLAPLSIEQAVAQDQQTVAYRLQIAEEERALRSPFDITSEYTFFGSIVHALAPKFARLTSGWSILSNLGMILQFGLINNFNKVGAASDPVLKYSICDDEDYQDAGFACTPFGNLAFGLPDFKAYDETYNFMVAKGHISRDGAALSNAYKTFVKNCPDRPQNKPYAWEDEGDPFDTDGRECKLDATTTYFYNWGVYYTQMQDFSTAT